MFESSTRKKVYKISLIFLFLVIFGTSSIMTWAFTTKLEEAVIGVGQIVPEGKLRKIMAPLNGYISKVYVKEDQEVKAGDILVELDPEMSTVQDQSLNQQLDFLSEESKSLKAFVSNNNLKDNNNIHGEWLEATKERYNAELKATNAQFESLSHEYKSIEAESNQIEEMLSKNEKLLNEYKTLVKEGAITEREFLDFEEKVIEQRGRKESLKESLKSKTFALEEIKERKNRLISAQKEDTLSRMKDFQRNIYDLNGKVAQSKINLEHQVIYAPIDGIVNEQLFRGEGEVVNAGNILMTIVPTDVKLFAEVKVSNMDLSYLKIGQKAFLTVDAFPYQQFGRLEGEVVSISPFVTELEKVDPKQPPLFIVRIKLKDQYFEKNNIHYKLRSGMTLTANMITHNKIVINYLIDPIKDMLNKAFRDPSTRYGSV